MHIEIAKGILKDNWDISIISKYTGFSISEIKTISKILTARQLMTAN